MLPTGETLLTWGFSAGSVGAGIGAGIWIAKLVGQGIKWTIEYFTGRLDKREADIDADMRELIEQLKDQVKSLSDDCKQMKAAHADCERRLTEVERRAAKAEATLQGFGDARNMLQVERAADKLAKKAAERKE